MGAISKIFPDRSSVGLPRWKAVRQRSQHASAKGISYSSCKSRRFRRQSRELNRIREKPPRWRILDAFLLQLIRGQQCSQHCRLVTCGTYNALLSSWCNTQKSQYRGLYPLWHLKGCHWRKQDFLGRRGVLETTRHRGGSDGKQGIPGFNGIVY